MSELFCGITTSISLSYATLLRTVEPSTVTFDLCDLIALNTSIGSYFLKVNVSLAF